MNNRHSSRKSSNKSSKSQIETKKRPDRYELHRRLQDLTYFEKRNGYEFEIRFAELRRDMGYHKGELQKIYDRHKGMFGVKES